MLRQLASRLVRSALVAAPDALLTPLSPQLVRRLAPERIITPDLLARVWPDLDHTARARLHTAITTRALRTLMAESFMRHGEPLSRHVRLVGERPTGPAILLNWHLGACRLARPALRAAGLKPLLISAFATHDPDLAYLGPESRVDERAAVALRALRQLRAGGLVMTMGDGPMGDRAVPVSVLGHTPRMRVGPATLAHLSRAPVHPVSATWLDAPNRHGEVLGHPALDLPYTIARDAFVEAASQRFAAWLDAHLRATPVALTGVHCDWLLGVSSPR